MPEGLARHWEKDIRRHAVQQPRATILEVIFHPQYRLFAQRHQPFFVAFTMTRSTP
jgi:hypothetical protein